MSSVCHCRDVYGSVFQGPKSCFAHGELCAMVNSAQLEILLQGVDIWNGWRKENPFESVDLRGGKTQQGKSNEAKLKGATLIGCRIYAVSGWAIHHR